MAQVILLIKVFVEDPEKFDDVKKKVELLAPDRLEEEPIGFGVKVLKVTKVIPDEGGKQEEFEAQLSGIEGVRDIEIMMATRSL
jgi:translation elongation factor EF-1beta